MIKLGQFDGRAKFDLVENLDEARFGEFRPTLSQGTNQLVQLMCRDPAGQQPQADLFEPLKHLFSADAGATSLTAPVTDFLKRQHAVEHVERAGGAGRAGRGGFIASRERGRETVSRCAIRALRSADRAGVRGSCSGNLHRPARCGSSCRQTARGAVKKGFSGRIVPTTAGMAAVPSHLTANRA